MQLARELTTFQRELPELLREPANRNRHALIHGDRIAGVFDTPESALEAGYDLFGFDPFLVQEVTDAPVPVVFSRNIAPCRL